MSHVTGYFCYIISTAKLSTTVIGVIAGGSVVVFIALAGVAIAVFGKSFLSTCKGCRNCAAEFNENVAWYRSMQKRGNRRRRSKL